MAKYSIGHSPRAYLGVESPQPPNVFYRSRSPINPKDWRNYSIGDFWVVKTPHELWYLASLASDGSQKNPMATWIKLYPDTGSAGGVEQLQSDVGIAQGVDGSANVFGGSNINTVGSDNTLKINLNTSSTLSGDITVAGAVHLEELKNGVVQANADGSLYTSRGNDGELFIGRTGLNQIHNSFTSSNNSITITKSPGGIDLSAAGGGAAGATDFPTDAGIAQEVAGVLNVLGGTNVNTSGAGNAIAINLDNSVSLTGNLTVSGQVTLPTAKNGVLSVDNTGLISTSRGSNGQLLISETGANPTWSNLISSDGSINIVNNAGSIGLSVLGGGGGIGSHAFSAYKSFDTILPTTGSSNIVPFICNTELIDDGGNYDNATGIFTAPSAGYYLFNVALSAATTPVSNPYSPTSPCELYASINGDQYKLAGVWCLVNYPNNSSSDSRYRQLGVIQMTFIIYLNIGWEVIPEASYQAIATYQTIIYGDILDYRTSFNGYKIK